MNAWWAIAGLGGVFALVLAAGVARLWEKGVRGTDVRDALRRMTPAGRCLAAVLLVVCGYKGFTKSNGVDRASAPHRTLGRAAGVASGLRDGMEAGSMRIDGVRVETNGVVLSFCRPSTDGLSEVALDIFTTHDLATNVWQILGGVTWPAGTTNALVFIPFANLPQSGAARAFFTWGSGADADGDGVSDAHERFCRGTDPRRADTDGDGVTDGEELARELDPRAADTDGDGYCDGEEVLSGQDPRVPHPDAACSIRYYYDDDDRLIASHAGRNEAGGSCTLSPTGNPNVLQSH